MSAVRKVSAELTAVLSCRVAVAVTALVMLIVIIVPVCFVTDNANARNKNIVTSANFDAAFPNSKRTFCCPQDLSPISVELTSPHLDKQAARHLCMYTHALLCT
jgi:hypothetical protein